MIATNLEKATFGAGCFWGVEEVFRKVPGVIETAVGYAGGHTVNPSYEQVCNHNTGHAEVVEMLFDPQKVSFSELLDIFWSNHNPTTLNRQGPDYGEQYRSVIFFHTPEQERVARLSKDALAQSGKWNKPIVTAIEPASTFYRAEEYHQQYLNKLGIDNCHI